MEAVLLSVDEEMSLVDTPPGPLKIMLPPSTIAGEKPVDQTPVPPVHSEAAAAE
jgi:hypothetical protein